MHQYSNNIIPKQTVNIPRNYTFDLKVNVDFNSGHVNLNVPNQPFGRKDTIPIINAQHPPPLPHFYHQHSAQSNNNQLIHRNMVQNQQFMQKQMIYKTLQTSPSLAFYDGTHTKGRTSLNTTTFMAQQKLPPVQCVICQKFISEQNFALHLQQHRNRKRAQNYRDHNLIQNSCEISIRNKNQTIQYIDNVRNSRFYTQSHPSNQQIQLSFTNSNPSILSHRSSSLTPPIQSHQPHLFPVEHSQMPLQISNYIIKSKNGESSLRLSQSSNSSQNHNFLNHSSIANNFNHNQQLPSYSVNQNASGFTLMGNLNHDKSSKIQAKLINDRQDFNDLQFNKIESLIIRRQQSNKQLKGFDGIGESAISRNSVQSQTALSQLQNMNNQLRNYYSHNDSVNSQDSNDSLQVYPSKIYRSIQRSGGQPIAKSIGQTIKKKIDRSTYTQKPLKSKLPTNFLAVQDFLTNSTSSSNFRYKSQK